MLWRICIVLVMLLAARVGVAEQCYDSIGECLRPEGTATPTATPTPTGAVCARYEIAATGDDGKITREDTAWPPAGSYTCSTSAVGVFQSYSAVPPPTGTYWQGQMLLRWDTSGMADSAEIATAQLYVDVSGAPSNANSRDLVCEYYAWGGTCDDSDWTATPGNEAASVAVSSLVLSRNAIALSNAATAGHISLTGYTEMRCGIGPTPAPSGGNEVQFTDYSTAPTQAPQLDICVKFTPTPLPGGFIDPFIMGKAERTTPTPNEIAMGVIQ